MEAVDRDIDDQSSTQKHVFLEQARILQNNMLVSVPANFICASIVFLGLYQARNSAIILSWFIAAIAITILRFIAFYFYHKRPQHTNLHVYIFLIGLTLSAALWGIADSILMPENAPFEQMIIIVIIAGVTAGSVQTLNANLKASIIYVSLSIVPLCAWLFIQGEFVYVLLGSAMTTYLFFMLVTSVRGHKLLLKALTLQYENLALLQKITTSNTKLLESYSTLKQHEHQIILVNKLSDMLQVCHESNEAYTAINLVAKELFTEFGGGLAIRDTGTHKLKIATQWGNNTILKPEFTIDDCWALRKGQAYHVQDKTVDFICQHFISPPKTYICIPLITQGQTTGLLILYSFQKDHLTNDDIQLINSFNEVINLSLANIKLRESLYEQSIHDPLTGLFNRRYLDESLARELQIVIRENKSLCVAMFDLDHFKKFNDTNGHEAGDEALKRIGALFRNYFRESDIACRFGGEEFLVVLVNTDLSLAHPRLETIREAIKKEKIFFNGHPLPPMTVSIGVAEAPMHGLTVMEIIHAADIALYSAKENGRDRIEYFNSSFNQSSEE